MWLRAETQMRAEGETLGGDRHPNYHGLNTRLPEPGGFS